MNAYKRFSMRLLLVTGLVSVCCTAGRVGAAVDAAAIDAHVKAALKDEGYPSLSVGIVSDQALAYAKAYGVADRRTRQPATRRRMRWRTENEWQDNLTGKASAASGVPASRAVRQPARRRDP